MASTVRTGMHAKRRNEHITALLSASSVLLVCIGLLFCLLGLIITSFNLLYWIGIPLIFVGALVWVGSILIFRKKDK